MNGCTAPIILMWPMCEIARSPTATSNTGRCSSLRPGAPTIVPCSAMWASICSTCCVGVAERLQRERHRAVDDRHLPAADELLELDQREVRLDAGRVAVHQEARSCRSARAPSPARCGSRSARRARPPRPTSAARPSSSAASAQISSVDRVGGVAVHPHHVRCAPRGSPRSARTGRAPRRPRADCAVGAAGHQRGDRRRGRAARRRSRRACRRPSGRRRGWRSRGRAGGTRARCADLLGRVAGRADDDLLREQHDVDGVLEGLDVEACRRRGGTSSGSATRGCRPSRRRACTREHGFDALMRPEFGQVCQRLIVVSYCTPGSAQRQAASAISRISSRARTARRPARRSCGRSGATRRRPRRPA